MRLDKFLKVSRIIKRRTVANEAGADSVSRPSNARDCSASTSLKIAP